MPTPSRAGRAVVVGMCLVSLLVVCVHGAFLKRRIYSPGGVCQSNLFQLDMVRPVATSLDNSSDPMLCESRCNSCSDKEMYVCNANNSVTLFRGDNCSALTQFAHWEPGTCVDRLAELEYGGGSANEGWLFECLTAIESVPPVSNKPYLRMTMHQQAARADPNVPCSSPPETALFAIDIDFDVTDGCIRFEDYVRYECTGTSIKIYECGTDPLCADTSCRLMSEMPGTEGCNSTSMPGADVHLKCHTPPSGIVASDNNAVEVDSPTSSTSLAGYWIAVVVVVLLLVTLYKRAKAELSALKLGTKARHVNVLGKLFADHSLIGLCAHYAGDTFSTVPRLSILVINAGIQLATTFAVLLINPDDAADSVGSNVGPAVGAILLSFVVGSTLSVLTGISILRTAMSGHETPRYGLAALAFVIGLLLIGAVAVLFFVNDSQGWEPSLDLQGLLTAWISSVILQWIITEPVFTVLRFIGWKERYVILPSGAGHSKVTPSTLDKELESGSMSDHGSDASSALDPGSYTASSEASLSESL